MEKDPLEEQLHREAYRIAYLIACFIRETITEEEHDELDAWIVASDANLELFEELTDPEYLEACHQAIEVLYARLRSLN